MSNLRLDAVWKLRTGLTAEGLWRCLGSASRREPRLAGEVERAMREAAAVSAPQAVVGSHDLLRAGRGRVSFSDDISVQGKILPHLFDGAAGAVFVVATAGPGIELRTRELFASAAAVEAFVMDAAGTALAMDALEQALGRVSERLASAGFDTGPCLVPGNDYWALEGQRDVFAAVPTERIGVRLLDSMVMVPQKSQSAVIPFGRELRVLGDPTASHCSTCKAVRCPIRREEYAEPLGT